MTAATVGTVGGRLGGGSDMGDVHGFGWQKVGLVSSSMAFWHFCVITKNFIIEIIVKMLVLGEYWTWDDAVP